MAILIGPNTKVICQGLTGRTATYHTERMIAYGTDVVAGVTPGKGGRRYLDRPIAVASRTEVDPTYKPRKVVKKVPTFKATSEVVV